MDMNTMINLDCEFFSKAAKASDEKEALKIIKEFASMGVARAIYYYMGYCSKHEELEKEYYESCERLTECYLEGVLPIRQITVEGSHLMILNPSAVEFDDLLIPSIERSIAEREPNMPKNKFYSEFDAAAFFFSVMDEKDARSLFQIALLYRDGYGIGVSYYLAFDYAMRAAEMGYANAQHYVADCYHSGCGVEKSMEKAFQWIKKAAESGQKAAQFNLSLLYRFGDGVEQSFTEMIKWLEKAADLGDYSAVLNLGMAYQNGWGVEQSYEKAAEYYSKAADRGEIESTYRLGMLMEAGLGIDRDAEKANDLFKSSIPKLLEMGKEEDCDIEFLIGNILENGRGIEADPLEARIWYNESVKHGGLEAKDALNRLNFDGKIPQNEDY